MSKEKQTISKQLAKCPFCGGEVKLHISELDAFRNAYSFLCNDCDMEITYPYSNEEEAIKAWNTRKPMERIVERLEVEKSYADDLDDDLSCGEYTGLALAIKIVKEEGDLNE